MKPRPQDWGKTYEVSWRLPNGKWNPEYNKARKRAHGWSPKPIKTIGDNKYGVPVNLPNGKRNPEYERRRRMTPEHKETERLWRQTPKRKAWNKQYRKKRIKTEEGLKAEREKLRVWRHKNPEKQATLKRKRARGLVTTVFLGDYSKGMDGHHFTKSAIAYIPRELHRLIRHDIWTGEGMDEINSKVIEFYEGLGRKDIVVSIQKILGHS